MTTAYLTIAAILFSLTAYFAWEDFLTTYSLRERVGAAYILFTCIVTLMAGWGIAEVVWSVL